MSELFHANEIPLYCEALLSVQLRFTRKDARTSDSKSLIKIVEGHGLKTSGSRAIIFTVLLSYLMATSPNIFT